MATQSPELLQRPLAALLIRMGVINAARTRVSQSRINYAYAHVVNMRCQKRWRVMSRYVDSDFYAFGVTHRLSAGRFPRIPPPIWDHLRRDQVVRLRGPCPHTRGRGYHDVCASLRCTLPILCRRAVVTIRATASPPSSSCATSRTRG